MLPQWTTDDKKAHRKSNQNNHHHNQGGVYFLGLSSCLQPTRCPHESTTTTKLLDCFLVLVVSLVGVVVVVVAET